MPGERRTVGVGRVDDHCIERPCHLPAPGRWSGCGRVERHAAAQRPGDDADAVASTHAYAVARRRRRRPRAATSSRRCDHRHPRRSSRDDQAAGLGEEVDVQRRNAGPRQLVRERAVERAGAAAAVHDHHCGNRCRRAGRPAQLGGNGAAPARVVRAHAPGTQLWERRRRGRRDRRERAHERGEHDHSRRTRHSGTIRHKALFGTLQTKPASSSREGWESRPASSRRRGASRSALTGTTAGDHVSRPLAITRERMTRLYYTRPYSAEAERFFVRKRLRSAPCSSTAQHGGRCVSRKPA